MARHHARTCLLLCCLILSGCALRQPYFRAATYVAPLSASRLANNPAHLAAVSADSQLDLAEASYATAIRLEASNDPRCLDEFWLVAQRLWPIVSAGTLDWQDRPANLYQAAVGKIVDVSQRFGRFDPVQGIRGAETMIPINYIGIAWDPTECSRFTVVGDYRIAKDIDPKRQPGIGTPLLGQHSCTHPFIYQNGVLPATAVVRPNQTGQFELSLINSHTIRDIQIGDRSLPLAYDLSATFAFLSAKSDHSWLTGFVRPEKVESSTGLKMIEPYQPGKIPVVFIHGLASDPLTWAAMANELSVHIDVLHKYQFWIFSYPTGKPFPSEAANLRRQLVELRSQIDPQQRDPLLDQMVLIGHSMGGLISKMQITTSDGELASIVFGKPVRQLRIPENLQDDVIGTFEFEPSTQIQRVIFMGTPHRGSKLASLGVGRLASRIVKEPTELVTRFNEIAQLNQDAMGLKRIPSSVDLLQPDNEMLNAIYELPVNPQVRIHTVLGTSHGGHLGIEKSDGVVPVSSAQHPGSESELHVKATHTKLHHKPESVVEVVRILRDHAVVSGQVEYSGSMATRRTLTRRQ